MQRTTTPDATRKSSTPAPEAPAARGSKIDRGQARERGYDGMTAALSPGAYFDKVGRTFFGTPHPPRDSRWGAYVTHDGRASYEIVRARWRIVDADGTPYRCDESAHQDIDFAELATCQLVAYDFEEANASLEQAKSICTSNFERRIQPLLPAGARVEWLSVTLDDDDTEGDAASKATAKGQAARS
jgi:hypothetical protein